MPGTEADFWQSLDRDGFGGNFGVWYRFLNCGYRLPASAGTDNVGMGVGVWKGYNRVYDTLEMEANLNQVADLVIEVLASERLVANLRAAEGGSRMEQVLWAASGSEAIQKALWAALKFRPGAEVIADRLP